MLEIRPCSRQEAQDYIRQHHRHNKSPGCCKYQMACYDGERLCGVAMVGRPVNRNLDDGATVEVLRNCTDGTKDSCSKLYGACCRAAKALGYQRIVTYTLMSEPGISLKASGWKRVAENIGGGTWDTPSRRRELAQQTLFGEEQKYSTERKVRWEKRL